MLAPLSSRVLGSNPAVLMSGRGVRPPHYSPALSLHRGTRQKLHMVTMGLRNNIQQLHTPFLEHLLCASHLVGAGETAVNSVAYQCCGKPDISAKFCEGPHRCPRERKLFQEDTAIQRPRGWPVHI